MPAEFYLAFTFSIFIYTTLGRPFGFYHASTIYSGAHKFSTLTATIELSEVFARRCTVGILSRDV